MADIRLVGEQELRGVRLRLERLVTMNYTALHKEIGEYLVSETQERFKGGRGPSGRIWPKSLRAKLEGGQTLIDTRKLENSITYKAAADRVDVGTNDRRAAVHQEGMEIKPKSKPALRFRLPGGKWVKAKKVRIPARPFIGINKRNEDDIKDIIAQRIRRAMR